MLQNPKRRYTDPSGAQSGALVFCDNNTWRNFHSGLTGSETEASKVSLSVRHERLGYPYMQIMKKLMLDSDVIMTSHPIASHRLGHHRAETRRALACYYVRHILLQFHSINMISFPPVTSAIYSSVCNPFHHMTRRQG